MVVIICCGECGEVVFIGVIFICIIYGIEVWMVVLEVLFVIWLNFDV